MISDLSRYKRFFAFGCSFTSYVPPTWANILASEMPDCEFYNFGIGGGGNLFITNRIVQANRKFKFNEDDLIIVMFSSMCREDRFIDGKWHLHGNVFNQSYYNKNFVMNYCDPIGYIVRDMALIEMAQVYLSTVPSTVVLLSMMEMSFDSGLLAETQKINMNDPALAKCEELYKDIRFPCMVKSGKEGYHGLRLRDRSGKMRQDGHPLTEDHLKFLLDNGFPITERGIQYTKDAMDKCSRAKSWEELYQLFKAESEISMMSSRALI